MPQVQFDPFGEPTSASRLGSVSERRPARWAERMGTGLFWTLVVAILSARALYFDPNFAAKFDHLAALSRSMLATLGV